MADKGIHRFGTGPHMPLNLLDNAGFGAFSNSALEQGTTGRQTDYEVGSAIFDDDCEDDGTGDYSLTDCTMAFTADAGNGAGGSDGYYTVTESDATQEVIYACSGLTVDNLYKFSLYLKNGTYTLTADDLLRAVNNADTATLATTKLASCADWTEFSVIWKATEANNKVKLALNMGGGETVKIDNWHVHEVTPGCVAADSLAFDGWKKDSTLKIYRELGETKDGSYYSLKFVPSAADDFIQWPLPSIQTNKKFYKNFSGKIVAFGAWVYASAASHVILRIGDGVSITDSAYHSGGGGWEWIEISKTVSSSNDRFWVLIRLHQSSGVAYVSQPVLVFGSSIGRDNYYPKIAETIYFEKKVASHKFNGQTFSDVATAAFDPEADSCGRVPKGAKALRCYVSAKDSGSNASDCYFRAGQDISDLAEEFVCSPYGLAADTSQKVVGMIPLNEDGEFEYGIEATGANTFDIDNFNYIGVQLR